jgi:hypothetical protein
MGPYNTDSGNHYINNHAINIQTWCNSYNIITTAPQPACSSSTLIGHAFHQLAATKHHMQ